MTTTRLSFRPIAFALAALPFLLAESPARAELPRRVNPALNPRGAGASPFREKEQALARLIEVHDVVDAGAADVGDRDHALQELADAIEELEESLEPELWLLDDAGDIEGSRLDPEEGAHVFHEERHAAQEIFDAIEQGKIANPDLREELLSIVDVLVAVDRLLADIAIQDAIAAGGDQEEIDEALAQLERGDALVKAAAGQASLALRASLLYEAIDNAYRHAWEEAIDAARESFSGLSAERHTSCGLGQCGGQRWGHRKPA